MAVVLHEEAAESPLGAAPLPDRGDVVLVIGPEGGISPEELAAFEAAGATAYRLGPSSCVRRRQGAVGAVLLFRTARWR